MKFLIAAALAAAPAAAYAQDAGYPQDAAPAPVTDAGNFDGVRAEARLGYETPTVSEDGDVYKIGSAVSYGAEVGFDLALGGKVVVGPYATYEFSSVKLCDAGACLKERGNLGVGGRLGYAASDRVLVYAKVGYAQIRFKANTAFGSGSSDTGGISAGIGANYNLHRNVYAGVEFNYADYGDDFGVNLQRRHVAGMIGVRF